MKLRSENPEVLSWETHVCAHVAPSLWRSPAGEHYFHDLWPHQQRTCYSKHVCAPVHNSLRSPADYNSLRSLSVVNISVFNYVPGAVKRLRPEPWIILHSIISPTLRVCAACIVPCIMPHILLQNSSIRAFFYFYRGLTCSALNINITKCS